MIDAALKEDIYKVALAMRQRDFDEISAVNMANTREDLADSLSEFYSKNGNMIAARIDGEAIAIGGAVEVRPNVAALLFFATDDFHKVAVPVTRFIKSQLFPSLEASGIHRIECASLVGYDYTRRWLKMLGMRAEIGTMQAFGKNGEDFTMFAKVSKCS